MTKNGDAGLDRAPVGFDLIYMPSRSWAPRTQVNYRNGIVSPIRFLTEMRERGLHRRTIFYTGRVDPGRGVPAYAFGITDRPDHLLHLVFDALERERG